MKDTPVIHIVGLGVEAPLVLSTAAKKALMSSDIVIGAPRQLALVASLVEQSCTPPTCKVLPKLSALKALIEAQHGKKITVLASGDPLHYGIGKWFARHVETRHIVFHPAVSSIQAACHRQGVSLQDVTVVSLHGRPLETLRVALKPQTTLVILTDKHSQPQALAKECARAGFDESTLTVYENIGYAHENTETYHVSQLLALEAKQFDPLHVTIINVAGVGGVLPVFPGIPDAHYLTGEIPGKGMISKREVRLAILSFMQASHGDIIWDIGAGCGGVAIELAYWQPRAQIYAIECNVTRLQYLKANQVRFGVVSHLHVIAGRAPDVLSDLPLPTKVFIGGSDGELSQLLAHVWGILPPNGILVASAVMDNTKQQLVAFAEELLAAKHPEGLIESVEIAVKRSTVETGKLMYTEKLPVEIFTFTKVGEP